MLGDIEGVVVKGSNSHFQHFEIQSFKDL